MNGQNDTYQNDESDDIVIEATAGTDEEPLEAGTYIGKLVRFKQEDKPQWKIDQQKAQNPTKEIDTLQWSFTFEITEGEYAGRRITTWENRSLSWHERANATKIVCALLNVPTLEGYQGSTKQLIGLHGQLWVTEKNGKNYLDKVMPVPRRKAQRPAQAQGGVPQRQVVPEPQWAGAPARVPRDGGDLDWE